MDKIKDWFEHKIMAVVISLLTTAVVLLNGKLKLGLEQGQIDAIVKIAGALVAGLLVKGGLVKSAQISNAAPALGDPLKK